MKIPKPATPDRASAAYLLVEALVYIGVVFVILGCGYGTLYRYIDNSMTLRRSAGDLSKALHAGERWRADLRTSRTQSWSTDDAAEPVLLLSGGPVDVSYRFADHALFRRRGTGTWATVLTQVKSSTMKADPREHVTAWRWELELQPRAKGSVKPGSIRPLFTFIAVPQSRPAK